MITFADIQKIYRNEKASVELQKLDDNFYRGSLELLIKIDEVNKVFVAKMFSEIFERRRNKIIFSLLRTTEKEPVNMTSQEKIFFEMMAKTLEDYRNSLLSDGKELEAAAEKNGRTIKKTKLKFLQMLPAIIGTDMVHYGPFNENDVAELPKENAEILIEQNVAEETD
jgi:DNA replication initiation complex subunit (GINS family)